MELKFAGNVYFYLWNKQEPKGLQGAENYKRTKIRRVRAILDIIYDLKWMAKYQIDARRPLLVPGSHLKSEVRA